MTISRKWLIAWAAQYPDGKDRVLHELAGLPMFTKSRAQAVIRWKSARSLGYFDRNRDSTVRRATQQAFSAPSDADALTALLPLHGVGERVASAILMAHDPARYTVMDWRAYASLRDNGLLSSVPPEGLRSWRSRWPFYLEACRRLARQHELPLREVDRALFRAGGSSGLP